MPHARIADAYARLLVSDEGRAALAAFEGAYPETGLHDVKKLDLLMWQTRQG